MNNAQSKPAQGSQENVMPSPELLFNTANAYQRTAALKTGVELEVFTAIAEGRVSAADIAKRCGAAERGVRILCDYLCIIGFLTKDGGHYGLTKDTAVFLDRNSPAYAGSMLDFLNAPEMMGHFGHLTAAVRKGGSATPADNTVSPDNPVWVTFARAMMPLMAVPAQAIAKNVLNGSTEKMKVLDIAGGHGLFGIAFAQQNPNASVTLQDWAAVVAVGRENAQQFGVAGRFGVLPGDAFEVEFGTGYDVILLTNFLHHFDPAAIAKLLKKVHAALAPGGRVVSFEFIPNADRVTPPIAAAFPMLMLVGTPSGDAYTFAEFERMFQVAGFTKNIFIQPPGAPQQLIISRV